MPVIISEYGVPSSRGRAQSDRNTGRSQGGMSEEEQGKALVQCYKDIMASGCAGSVAFTWQDEWFKHTWNTMYAVDLSRNIYWEDAQTNDQHFGLLAFDCGENALNSCTINCGKAITYRFPFLFRLVTKRLR